MGSGVLFVHNNFPAQFGDLARTLVARGVPCAAIGSENAPNVPGVRIFRYKLTRGTTPNIFPFAVRPEADLLRARAALSGARALKEHGFDPAVIVGHPGWGETVLLDDCYPQAKQVLYAEYFYRGRDRDIGFDNEFIQTDDQAILLGKTKNAVGALALTDAEVIVAPTEFQASLLPDIFKPRVRIIHEGVDVEAIRPGPAEPLTLADGRTIAPGTPVVTHINNQLEPLRGLHIFLRALPRLLDEVPQAHAVIIGSETKSAYGGVAPGEGTWKDACLEGVSDRLDWSRVHFLGRTSHPTMLNVLRLSTAHVYYSYPFVLSWSLVEAMASGCYVIGSDTAPLHDAIEDGVNGRLLPFFDVDALSDAMVEACRHREAAAALRKAARETAVARFSAADGRAAWLDTLRELGVELG